MDKGGGVPVEYINEPPQTQQELKQGRFPEMEEAMRTLFFSDNDEEQNDEDKSGNI